MERIVTVKELQELREKLLSPSVTDEEKQHILSFFGNTFEEPRENTTSTSNFENPKTLVKTNPSAPSLLEDAPSSPPLFDKSGFSNVIYLATISLVFEVLFLAISFLIYK